MRRLALRETHLPRIQGPKRHCNQLAHTTFWR